MLPVCESTTGQHKCFFLTSSPYCACAMMCRATRNGSTNPSLAALERFEKENCSAPCKARQKRKTGAGSAAGAKKREKDEAEPDEAGDGGEGDDDDNELFTDFR